MKITVSVGLAQLDPVLDGWESMMRRADIAMYRAKSQGRNQAVEDFGSAAQATGNNTFDLNITAQYRES